MKNIEILTANNITIQYEASGIGIRGIALLIDVLINLFFFIVMAMVIGVVSYANNEFFEVLIYILIFLPMMFYSFVLEYFLKGQTVGKLAMGIRTIKLNGQNANFNDYAMRWSFRLIDLWFSFGGIGALFITTTENSQRIGDLLAQTTVVKKSPTQRYNIHDILNIKDKSKHEPTYYDVTMFTDEDMILIKNALSRVKKYPNKAHKQLIRELSTKLTEQLKLAEEPKKKLTFLNTVLQDYIVLTR